MTASSTFQDLSTADPALDFQLDLVTAVLKAADRHWPAGDGARAAPICLLSGSMGCHQPACGPRSGSLRATAARLPYLVNFALAERVLRTSGARG